MFNPPNYWNRKEVNVGDKIQIISDNPNYSKYRNKTWTVTSVAYSEAEHALYDTAVGGPLISCKGLPFSLYGWEFEVVG